MMLLHDVGRATGMCFDVCDKSRGLLILCMVEAGYSTMAFVQTYVCQCQVQCSALLETPLKT